MMNEKNQATRVAAAGCFHAPARDCDLASRKPMGLAESGYGVSAGLNVGGRKVGSCERYVR